MPGSAAGRPEARVQDGHLRSFSVFCPRRACSSREVGIKHAAIVIKHAAIVVL